MIAFFISDGGVTWTAGPSSCVRTVHDTMPQIEEGLRSSDALLARPRCKGSGSLIDGRLEDEC